MHFCCSLQKRVSCAQTHFSLSKLQTSFNRHNVGDLVQLPSLHVFPSPQDASLQQFESGMHSSLQDLKPSTQAQEPPTHSSLSLQTTSKQGFLSIASFLACSTGREETSSGGWQEARSTRNAVNDKIIKFCFIFNYLVVKGRKV